MDVSCLKAKKGEIEVVTMHYVMKTYEGVEV
jgi:hypothetical protein